jgi:hypothetical protein
MLPIIACIGLFASFVSAEGSFSTVMAGATFISLAVFVLFGALRIMRDSEEPEQAGH